MPKTTRTNRIPRERKGQSAPRSARRAVASQALVRTVAERLAAGRLAAAQPDLLGRRGGERHGGEAGPLVRAVAEGLVGAASARTPKIPLAGLDIDAVGLFLRGYGFGHCFFPATSLASVRTIRLRFATARTVSEARRANKPGGRAVDPAARSGGERPPAKSGTKQTIRPATPRSPTTSSEPSQRSTTSARCCPARGSPREWRTRITW